MRARLTLDALRETLAQGRELGARADQIRTMLSLPMAADLERTIAKLPTAEQQEVSQAIQSARLTMSRLANVLETLDTAIERAAGASTATGKPK